MPTVNHEVCRVLWGNQCILVKAAVRIPADRKWSRNVE